MNCRIAIGHPIGLLAIAAFGALVALVLLATTVWAGETSGNFGYGGIYEWVEGNTFRGSGYPLGITYTPDRVQTVITRAGIVEEVVSSPLFFTVTHVVRDGDPDFTFTGIGYRLYDWKEAGVQIFLEADAVLKMVDVDTYKAGGALQVRVPCKVNSQAFQAQIGGGWCDRPILIISLSWLTK